MRETHQAVHTENHRHTRNRIQVVLIEGDIVGAIVSDKTVTVLDQVRWSILTGKKCGFTMVDDRIDFNDPETSDEVRQAHLEAKAKHTEASR